MIDGIIGILLDGGICLSIQKIVIVFWAIFIEYLVDCTSENRELFLCKIFNDFNGFIGLLFSKSLCHKAVDKILHISGFEMRTKLPIGGN